MNEKRGELQRWGREGSSRLEAVSPELRLQTQDQQGEPQTRGRTGDLQGTKLSEEHRNQRYRGIVSICLLDKVQSH